MIESRQDASRPQSPPPHLNIPQPAGLGDYGGWDREQPPLSAYEEQVAHVESPPATHKPAPAPAEAAAVKSASDERVAKAAAMLETVDLSDEEREAIEADGVDESAPGDEAGGALAAAAKGADLQGKPDPNWRRKLLVNNEGTARTILANAIHILRNDPDFCGVFGFDQFAQRNVFMKAPPWSPRALASGDTDLEVSDHDVLLATEWIQRQGRLFVKDNIVRQAIEAVAREFSFHPVRDYLNGLVWDGVPRVCRWVVDHAGADATEIVCEMSSKFLISAVARVFHPGCKVDTMLVLEGGQGLKKSTAFRALAEPWFTDHLPDLANKDSMIQLQGKWIIEIAATGRDRHAANSEIVFFMSDIAVFAQLLDLFCDLQRNPDRVGKAALAEFLQFKPGLFHARDYSRSQMP